VRLDRVERACAQGGLQPLDLARRGAHADLLEDRLPDGRGSVAASGELRQVADAAAPRNAAAIGRLQPGEDPEQRGLAGAVGADERGAAAGADAQVEGVESVRAAWRRVIERASMSVDGMRAPSRDEAARRGRGEAASR
jgi:hypothetical protein